MSQHIINQINEIININKSKIPDCLKDYYIKINNKTYEITHGIKSIPSKKVKEAFVPCTKENLLQYLTDKINGCDRRSPNIWIIRSAKTQLEKMDAIIENIISAAKNLNFRELKKIASEYKNFNIETKKFFQENFKECTLNYQPEKELDSINIITLDKINQQGAGFHYDTCTQSTNVINLLPKTHKEISKKKKILLSKEIPLNICFRNKLIEWLDYLDQTELYFLNCMKLAVDKSSITVRNGPNDILLIAGQIDKQCIQYLKGIIQDSQCKTPITYKNIRTKLANRSDLNQSQKNTIEYYIKPPVNHPLWNIHDIKKYMSDNFRDYSNKGESISFQRVVQDCLYTNYANNENVIEISKHGDDILNIQNLTIEIQLAFKRKCLQTNIFRVIGFKICYDYFTHEIIDGKIPVLLDWFLSDKQLEKQLCNINNDYKNAEIKRFFVNSYRKFSLNDFGNSPQDLEPNVILDKQSAINLMKLIDIAMGIKKEVDFKLDNCQVESMFTKEYGVI